ncbi:MAG: helicase-related protein [Pseudomonadota bacterium]
MNDLIKLATRELTQFLLSVLPPLDVNWWQKLVVERLSFQQQRLVQEKGFKGLKDLDFAGLLRVLDQNWYDLSNALSLPREARNWVKELQTVRNKWAHLSSQEISLSEVYRDTDTLGRLLSVIGASTTALSQIESRKTETVKQLAGEGRTALDETIMPPSMHNKLPCAEQQPKQSPADTPTMHLALFSAGELVCLRSDPSIIMPVIEVLASGPGERRYRVFQNNAKATYYESQLQSVNLVSDKHEYLTVEAMHAQLTSLQLLAPSSSNLYSLRSGRVKFVPYQYRPVLKLIRADRPRLLIADEVGVGKTIEAGLIIKELRARMDLSSVLIICPKALVAERKWFLEMKRFDEHFTAFDGPLLRHCLRETNLDGEWPDQYARTIIPFSLFDSDLLFGREGRSRAKDQGLLKLDPPPKFDLVIVDEAHHLRNSSTYLHQGVKYFCDNAEAVVFMTATPVQLGSQDLYTLLNILRPDLIIDPVSFAQMAEPNRFINAAVQHCRAGKTEWAQETQAKLDEAGQTEWGRIFLRESPAFQGAYDRLSENQLDDVARVGLTRSIEELYTFSSLINRTRRRDIGEFTTRKPETLTVKFTPPQQNLHDGLLDIIARILAFYHGNQNVKFMMTTVRRQAASCLYGLVPLLDGMLNGKLDRPDFLAVGDDDAEPDLGFVDQVRPEIGRLLENARNLDPHDPKVEAFIKVLQDKQALDNNKVLLFSTFRHTLAYLAKYATCEGFRFGLVHGDIPDDDRAELRHRFSLPKENANALDVLLSSEVGCEGLDFQFCDCLINYDLPWNPMRIEQRIGRIDRYGQQSKTVAIVNMITPGTVDADIYERCLQRIGVFQHAIGGNEEILGEITQEIHDIAENFQLTSTERENRLCQLSDNSIRQLQEQQELESKQAELFGLNIPSQERDKEVAAADSYWLSSSSIQRCVSTYLTDRLGKEQDYLLGDKPLKTLRLNHEARNRLLEDFRRLPKSTEPVFREWEKWLKGVTPMLQVTFEQEAAVEDSKATLLSVTHPLVRQAALHLKKEEPVYVNLTVNMSEEPPGLYPFGVYRWTKHGVKQDAVLMPIAYDPVIEERLFLLLQEACTTESAALPDTSQFDTLDVHHHSKWTAAQANHMAENRQQVEYRRQSLMASHRARCKALEDQLNRATNDKIRLMRQGELSRANADYERRIQELERAAGSGDIHATPVLFGTITVIKEEVA